MFNRKVLTVLVLAASTLAPMASYAAPPAAKAAPCILREHRITALFRGGVPVLVPPRRNVPGV